jgi:hypothetical protein
VRLEEWVLLGTGALLLGAGMRLEWRRVGVLLGGLVIGVAAVAAAFSGSVGVQVLPLLAWYGILAALISEWVSRRGCRRLIRGGAGAFPDVGHPDEEPNGLNCLQEPESDSEDRMS